MTSSSTDLYVELIDVLRRGDEAAIVALLSQASIDDPVFAAMVRAAIFHASPTPFYYRKVMNGWLSRNRPGLKPAVRKIKIELLSDGTVDGLVPYLDLFCAAYGLDAQIAVAPYNSVEHIAFISNEASDSDVTIVLMSDHWLVKHLGAGVTTRKQVSDAKRALGEIADGLKVKRGSHVLFGNFGYGPWPVPGSAVSIGDNVGHSAAVAEVNGFLSSKATGQFHVLDAALAVHLAGGVGATARIGYLRTHAVLDERGFVQVAREAASGIAHLLGRSHRALLTDWDNTLWGGEVGELGSHQIVCGQDSADALGYHLLQSHLASLNASGIILAAVSRNDPAVARVLDENTSLVLRRSNFSSLALSWGDKSNSVTQIAGELNFGADLMLYIDDNPVDLAQVITHHPYIDVVLAGPTPDYSLSRLCSARYFNVLSLTLEDTRRAQQASAIVDQGRQMRAAADPAAFLRSLGMRLTVEPVTADNRPRVLQLLQKTNQFNVTTRRHGDQELQALQGSGADIGVFSYSDKFGPQGIIGLIIAVRSQGATMIDTWLMSCRVLNRGVENAMFEWLRRKSGTPTVLGEYIPTAKNKLVSGLFDRMGFSVTSDRAEVKTYQFRSSEDLDAPSHDLELIDE